MPLWSLFGGAAKGFGNEGRYLDQMAQEARQQALRERTLGAETEYRKQSLEAEKEYRKQQLETMKMEATAREAAEQRRHDQIMANAKQEHEDRVARYNLDNREVGIREAALKPEQEMLKAMNPWQRAVYVTQRDFKPNPYASQEENDAELKARLDALRTGPASDFFKEHIKTHPEDDPDFGYHTGLKLFQGVKTKQQADKVWSEYKKKNRRLSPIVDDGIAQAYQELMPSWSSSPESKPLYTPEGLIGATARQTGKNYRFLEDLADKPDPLEAAVGKAFANFVRDRTVPDSLKSRKYDFTW